MSDESQMIEIEALKIPPAELSWRCVEDWLTFSTTADLEPICGVVGQDDAVEALRFGLEIDAPGQNIYVRGLTGTGRATTVEQLLADINPPCPPTEDRCYVHNFVRPDTPLLITLPRGKGAQLAQRMDDFVLFVKEQLAPELASDTVRARRGALDDTAQESVRQLGKPFEEELRENDLALVPLQLGQTVQPAIVPLINGEPVALNKFEELVATEEGGPARVETVHRKISEFAKRFEELSQKIRQIQIEHMQALKSLFENEARRILDFHVKRMQAEFPESSVQEHLERVIDDLVMHRLQELNSAEIDFTRFYRVNPILRLTFVSSRP